MFNDNDIKLFTENAELYRDLLNEIDAAKNFINVEYFIIRDDEIGRKFVNMLAKKAFEGLKVRLLYDDIGCINLSKNFFYCIIKSGGEILPFLPSSVKIFNRTLYATTEIAVIDGVTAYIGSSNIGESIWEDIKDCAVRMQHLKSREGGNAPQYAGNAGL